MDLSGGVERQGVADPPGAGGESGAAAAVAPGRGLTIPELAAASARRVPDRVAVSVDGQPVSHGQLDAEARRAAAWLAARLAPGERMLLAAGSGPGFLRWYLGALRAGVIVVLANPGYTAAELGHLVADSGARLAVADPGPARRLAALAGRRRGRAIVPAGRTPRGLPGDGPGSARRGRHRAARLHLRHHRAAQGRPADPPAAGRLHPGRHGGLAVEPPATCWSTRCPCSTSMAWVACTPR